MSVLDKTAALGNQLHGLGAQVLELAERSTLVIAALIRCQVEVLGLGDDVVLKFTHSLHLQTGHCLELTVSLVQYVLGAALKLVALAVKI